MCCGINADGKVTVSSATNVLAVPAAAVQTVNGASSVQVLENGAASPWLDWFSFAEHPANAYDLTRPPSYEAWIGLHALPKFRGPPLPADGAIDTNPGRFRFSDPRPYMTHDPRLGRPASWASSTGSRPPVSCANSTMAVS